MLFVCFTKELYLMISNVTDSNDEVRVDLQSEVNEFIKNLKDFKKLWNFGSSIPFTLKEVEELTLHCEVGCGVNF